MAAPDAFFSGVIAGTIGFSFDIILHRVDDNLGAGGITPAQVICDYAREDELPIPFSCVAGSLTGWVERGWVACAPTRHPGWYRLGIPNAALAPGRNTVTIAIHVSGTFDLRVTFPLVNKLSHAKRMARLTIPELLAEGPLDEWSIAALLCGLRRQEFMDIGGTRYLTVRDSNNTNLFQEPVSTVGSPFVQVIRTGPPGE